MGENKRSLESPVGDGEIVQKSGGSGLYWIPLTDRHSSYPRLKSLRQYKYDTTLKILLNDVIFKEWR